MSSKDFVQMTSDPDGEGYFVEDRDTVYCRHGHYIGYPGGPDYMCPHCEDGDDTLYKTDYWHLRLVKVENNEIVHTQPFYSEPALTLAVATLDPLINGPDTTGEIRMEVITDDYYFWGRGDDPELAEYIKVRKA